MPLPKKHKISLECKEILTPKNKQMFSRPNQWTPIFFSFSREGEGKRMVFVFFFFLITTLFSTYTNKNNYPDSSNNDTLNEKIITVFEGKKRREKKKKKKRNPLLFCFVMRCNVHIYIYIEEL